MICQPCRDQTHGQCPGGTRCDCQHRTEDNQREPETVRVVPDQRWLDQTTMDSFLRREASRFGQEH